MRTNKDIKFNYYTGNIFDTKPLGIIRLEQFIAANQNPSIKTLELLEDIRQATADKNLKLKRQLKHQLYAFTPSVIISEGGTRRYADVAEWTGLMQIDLDGIETIEEAIQIKNHIFEGYREIVCAFISPSGKGVKCLMKTIIPRNKQHYKALHSSMVDTFEEYSYLDLATKNAMLPLFISADEDILFRDYNECDAWAQENWTKTEYVQLNDTLPNNFSIDNIGGDYNTKKVVRITESRINNIMDCGHPQVRSTALILGSRVAAGYIDVSEARNLITSLIQNNSYLKKDLRNYLSTANWGISEGMKAPKYFK